LAIIFYIFFEYIEYFTIIIRKFFQNLLYRIFTLTFNMRKDESVHARDREIQDIDTEQLSQTRNVCELLLNESLLRLKY